MRICSSRDGLEEELAKIVSSLLFHHAPRTAKETNLHRLAKNTLRRFRNEPTMGEQPPDDANRCLLCGRDCSFIATLQGLCVRCGDALQALPQLELIADLVGALKHLAAANKRQASLRDEHDEPGPTPA